MKSLKQILTLLILSIASTSLQSAEVEGAVVLHSIRNSPVITRNGSAETIKTGKITDANGLKISCDKNQYASLKFSNEIVVEVMQKSEIEVVNFSQIQPFQQNHSVQRELSESKLLLNFKGSKIRVIAKEPRALSEFVISTRLGDFTMRATEFIVEDTGTEISVAVINGLATFKSHNGKSDFIRNKQKGIIKNVNAQSNFPLEIESIGMLEEKHFMQDLSACKQVQDSILFEFNSSKKLTAKRVIFKEFLLKNPKYNY